MNQFKMATRVARFPEYVFSRLARTVVEVEQESKRRVLNFGPGSPDIRPNNVYLNKLAEFIHKQDSHIYPGYKGIDEFNEAIVGWYKKRFGVILNTDEVLPLLGAKDGVSHLPLALANEDDEVLVPNPGYPAYLGPTLMIGAHPIFYDLLPENNFKISLEYLESKITEKTKYAWVNFPSNPTGQVVTLNDLEEIIAFSQRHSLPIIYDNAYSEITFDGFIAPSILQVMGAKETAVEIGSFSKTFSFAGFRMGWIVGNKRIIEALAKVKSQLDSGLSLPLQHLGAFALSHYDESWHRQTITSYKKRRDIISTKLKSLGLTFSLPKGALYIWARIPDSAKNSENFCMELLKRKQVLFIPGTAFGNNGERFVRVSICVNINTIDEYI